MVHCRAPAQDGRANEAIVRLLAEWLGVPSSTVRLVRVGSARTKQVVVDGLSDCEIGRRLGHVAVRSHP